MSLADDTLGTLAWQGAPGTFNPLLISQLDTEQTENWKQIAEFHIEKIAKFCTYFMSEAMISSADCPDVAARLKTSKISPALDNRLRSAKAELESLLNGT